MMEAVVDRVVDRAIAVAKDVEPASTAAMAQRVKELEAILWANFNTPTYRAFLEIQLHYSRGAQGVAYARRAGQSLDRTRDELAQKWLGGLGVGLDRCRLAVSILVAGLRGLALEAMTNRRRGKFEKERKLIVEAVVRALDDAEGSKGKRKGTR